MTLGLFVAARRAAESRGSRRSAQRRRRHLLCRRRREIDGGRAGAVSSEAKLSNLRRGMEVSRILHEMPKPVVAQVEWRSRGRRAVDRAGLRSAHIASASAKITTAFAKVGLSGDYGGTFGLTHLLGSAKARELYLTWQLSTAQEALALGIVNRVVPDAEVEAAAQELAMSLAHGPSAMLGYIKRNINNAEHLSLEACFDAEAMHHSRSGDTADHMEAAKAFVEKRKPAFSGH